MAPTMDDLDLAPDLPAGTPQSPVQISRATGVDQVVLWSGEDQRRTSDQTDLYPQPVGDPFD